MSQMTEKITLNEYYRKRLADITFDSKIVAEFALSYLKNEIEHKGFATITDFENAAGARAHFWPGRVPSAHRSDKNIYGWTSLDGAKIVTVTKDYKERFAIVFPPLENTNANRLLYPRLKEGDRIEVIGGEQHMSWKRSETYKPIINHIEFVHEYPRYILVKVFVGGIDEHSYMETIHKSAFRYLGIQIKPVA